MLNEILNKLNSIADDSDYNIEDNYIKLVINDFISLYDGCFEELRPLENEELVDEVLDWLEDNADKCEGDYYRYYYYYFGDIIVEVGYSSFDI